jgi:N-methylhydantoinase B
MTPLSHEEFDPVTLQVLWSRPISTTDESAAALLRASFPTMPMRSRAIGRGAR